MNGKLARAMRRHKDERATLSDVQRLQRKAQLRLVGVKMAPKPLKERAHKVAKSHAATWPASEDQKKQSRPVIYVRPVLALARVMMEQRAVGIITKGMADRIRSILRSNRPKHELDNMVRFELSKVA